MVEDDFGQLTKLQAGVVMQKDNNVAPAVKNVSASGNICFPPHFPRPYLNGNSKFITDGKLL